MGDEDRAEALVCNAVFRLLYSWTHSAAHLWGFISAVTSMTPSSDHLKIKENVLSSLCSSPILKNDTSLYSFLLTELSHKLLWLGVSIQSTQTILVSSLEMIAYLEDLQRYQECALETDRREGRLWITMTTCIIGYMAMVISVAFAWQQTCTAVIYIVSDQVSVDSGKTANSLWAALQI